MDNAYSKLPIEIQNACKLLEVGEHELTSEKILSAWKNAMVNTLVADDTLIVEKQSAKNVLLRWVQRFN